MKGKIKKAEDNMAVAATRLSEAASSMGCSLKELEEATNRISEQIGVNFSSILGGGDKTLLLVVNTDLRRSMVKASIFWPRIQESYGSYYVYDEKSYVVYKMKGSRRCLTSELSTSRQTTREFVDNFMLMVGDYQTQKKKRRKLEVL